MSKMEIQLSENTLAIKEIKSELREIRTELSENTAAIKEIRTELITVSSTLVGLYDEVKEMVKEIKDSGREFRTHSHLTGPPIFPKDYS